MTKWTAITFDAAEPATAYPVPRAATGVVEARLLSPAGYSLWLTHVQLAAGGTIEWHGEQSDDAVYVLAGEVELRQSGVASRRAPAGGAVLVESAAAATLVAPDGAVLLHFGAYVPGPARGGPAGDPEAPMSAVHVVGREGEHVSGAREGVNAVWFADGTCAHCRVQLFEVTSPPSEEHRGKAHHHSEDEIIVLMSGSVSMGAHHFAPLSAISIPGDVRYALVGGPDGHRFLNFRRDVSVQVYARGSEPLLETALARGGRPVSHSG